MDDERYRGAGQPIEHCGNATLPAGRLREGDYAGAIRAAQQASALTGQVLGNDSPDFAVMLYGLADLYRASGDSAGAERLYQQALDIAQQTLDPADPVLARFLNGLGELYRASGRYNAARPLLEQALLAEGTG